jgi:diaminopimelate epimerase
MNLLHFWKMQGVGNDFVVLDALHHPLPADFDFTRAAQVLCARHFGVGSDGLLLLDRPTADAAAAGAAIRMRMWNPDGSEDMCGNGLRCIVRLAHRHGHVPSTFVCETLAGLRACEVLPDGEIRIEMGEPQWDNDAIPLQRSPDFQGESVLNYMLQIAGEEAGPFTSLSTGSTHTILWSNEKLVQEKFSSWSPQLEHHPAFPERTSIMWTQVAGPHAIKLRIWERGAGETLACGTGACAAAVAAQFTGRATPDERGEISVESRGGVLRVQWQPGHPIFLSGPAEVVFQGKFKL